MSRPSSSSLPNITYSGNTQLTGAGTTDNNPLKANVLTLGAGTTLTSSTYGLFIWCNKLVMNANSFFNVNAMNGNDGENPCGPNSGGDGGAGASGGGGGGISTGCTCGGESGGSGGDGDDGGLGTGVGCNAGPGSGGAGHGKNYISAYPSLNVGSFTYPVGGSAGCCGNPSGPWGYGGFGGTTASGYEAQGGGGGGAGICCIIAGEIQAISNLSTGLYASGGAFGNATTCAVATGHNGGDGVLLVFTQKITGNTLGGLSFSTLLAYEIAHNGTSILNTYSADLSHTWNHL